MDSTLEVSKMLSIPYILYKFNIIIICILGADIELW